MGWCWEYWIYKLENWGSNEKQDKRISIFYNTNGKVDWITSTIEGLQESGGPKNKAIFLNTFDSKTSE